MMENHFPKDWSLLPLEDCVDAIIDYRGKTPRKSSFGIPLITAKIVKNGRIEEPNEFIPFEDYDERMQRGIPKAGDVVVSTEAPLGEVGQLDNRKLSVGQRLITLRGKDGLLDNTYLKFLMMSEFVQNQLIARATGTTVIGIKQRELRKVSLVLPPLPEQRAIAGILGALDDKIELNRRMNRTLESMARAVFRQWFVEGEEVGGWEEKPLDEIANYLNGLALQKFPAEEGADYLPVIKIAQLRKNDTKDADKASLNIPPEYIIEDGDILFSWSGSLEVVVWCGGKGALNQHLFKVTSDKYPKWFYYYWTKHHLPEFQAIAAGKATTMGHIQRHHLRDAKVLVPSEKELKEMDKVMSPILDKIIVNEKESRTLASLRDSLLPKLMRGEVRVKS